MRALTMYEYYSSNAARAKLTCLTHQLFDHLSFPGFQNQLDDGCYLLIQYLAGWKSAGICKCDICFNVTPFKPYLIEIFQLGFSEYQRKHSPFFTQAIATLLGLEVSGWIMLKVFPAETVSVWLQLQKLFNKFSNVWSFS